MPTLPDMIDELRERTGASYENLARDAGISTVQFWKISSKGFSEKTQYKTIRGVAELFDMRSWELLRELDSE